MPWGLLHRGHHSIHGKTHSANMPLTCEALLLGRPAHFIVAGTTFNIHPVVRYWEGRKGKLSEGWHVGYGVRFALELGAYSYA